MKLSVCVVHYHSEKDLEHFLHSFFLHRPDFLHEVIVVDNGSTHPHFHKHLQNQFGHWVQVIPSEQNVGFGAAQNKAVRRAKGEYVFLCNPDIRVHDASFRRLLHFADRLGDFGVIGPRLLHPDGEVQASCRRFPRLRDLFLKRIPFLKRRATRYLMKNVDLQQPIEVDWLVGAAMLMKRDRFLEVKGFDEQFFLFFEDTDLCRRLKEKGYGVWYHPHASFIHPRMRLSDSSFPGMWLFKKTFWIHLGSAWKYFAKWGVGKGRKDLKDLNGLNGRKDGRPDAASSF
ncbi:MAG: glycosyltransferase family 2 protein [Candidatus Altimarinota bacterium]